MSPRRKHILEQVGYKFDVIVSDYDEVLDQTMDPVALARSLSSGKASAVAKTLTHGVVLGADTIVAANGEILGKPTDEKDAVRMLSLLSGSSHLVSTGFTIIDVESGAIVTKSVEATVYFRSLDENEIRDYVASGEPMDKAGGYGAHDKAALFIDHIEGDFYTVIGLPICAVSVELKNFGISAIIKA